ncbi:hypothetical protein [Rahnella sp. AA]|uniref:hypothetical protein n=1 Tax=Rahnella sp. AA TaxID=2057180 RepID=UPI0012FF36C7|nr:hypothetical protein [Rahnella sp. AA]
MGKNETELMIPDKFKGLQGVAGIAGMLLHLRRGSLFVSIFSFSGMLVSHTTLIFQDFIVITKSNPL